MNFLEALKINENKKVYRKNTPHCAGYNPGEMISLIKTITKDEMLGEWVEEPEKYVFEVVEWGWDNVRQCANFGTPSISEESYKVLNGKKTRVTVEVLS